MTTDRMGRVERILDEALDRPTAERDAFVADACFGDGELRAEVAALLEEHRRMGAFLETAAVERFKGALFLEGSRVGAYRIVRVIGSGGGGTVYLAEQDRPRRHVALKAMHGGFATDTAATRFQREAEILARLQHPSIAHVYEAGVHDGVPFIVLEYVENAETIVDYVERNGLDRRDRLRLFARVCDAVHDGHLKGIVHRDLKPANLLVLPSGHPKVIDFGIARVEGVAAAGEIAGTPPYMSPEQCSPDHGDVDQRSDVYSLGVVLYGLLTGRLPHDVSGIPITEAARRIRELPPAPLDMRLPGDLRAIVGKAMAKEPEERCASAADLARDLRSFLDHRPVAARRAGRLHECRLFMRRNPALVASLAGLILVLLAATAVSLGFADRAAEARDRERVQAYVANIAAASAALRNYDVAEAKQRLRRAAPELRNWEWHYLVSRLDESVRTLRDPKWLTFAMVPHADGETIVELAHEEAMGGKASLALWSTATGEVRKRSTFVEYPTTSPVVTHGWIVWGTRGGKVLVAREDDLEVVRRLGGHRSQIFGMAASRDGARVASADYGGGIRVWETADWTLAREFGDEERHYAGIACSPDGSLVAVADDTRIVDVWDAKRGERLHTLEGHEARVQLLWFLGSGDRILTASADATLRLWETGTGRELEAIRGSESSIMCGALGDDETRVLTGDDGGTIRLWDLESAKVVETFLGHEETPRSVQFLPGERAASADVAGGIRLWELRKGGSTRGRYTQIVRDVAYSDDGRWMASASFDGTARLYRVGDPGEEKVLLGHSEAVNAVAFSPDSKRLVSGSVDETVRLWDVDTGECLRTIGHGAPVVVVAFGPQWIASALADNTVVLHDPETGALVRTLSHDQWSMTLIFLPGNGLLTACLDGKLRLWDPWTGTVRREMSFADKLMGAALAPDGRTLVVASRGPYDAAWRAPRASLHFVDLATWTRGRTVPGVAGALDFNADGSRLAVAAWAGVFLLDGTTGRVVLELPQRAAFWDVAFSPDGAQLATAAGSYVGHGCELRLWGRLSGSEWPPRLDER